jgi:hypothetical protein
MKNVLKTPIAILSLIFLFAACSTPQNVTTTNVSRGKFTGTWTLNNVSYQGLVQNSVQNVFDQAAPEAFVGSTWKLTNSGNGIYTLATVHRKLFSGRFIMAAQQGHNFSLRKFTKAIKPKM